MAAVDDTAVTFEEKVASEMNTDSVDTSDLTNDKSPKPSPNGSTQDTTNRKLKKVPLSQQTSAEEKNKDGHLNAETLLIASALVQDAKEGRTLEYIYGDKYVRSYNLYNHAVLRWLLYFCITLDLALALFEKPAMPVLSVPYWGTIIIEVLCLSYFVVRLLHAFYFQYSKVFIKDPKNIMVVGVIILTLIDIVCYIFWINLAPNTHPVRWSRPLRPLFIINFSDGKQIRRAFRNMRRTIPEIMNVLFLSSMNVLLFGLIALKLFYKRDLTYPNGDPYFKNYLDCVWDLYVLVTTSNSPDVMMPAYDRSGWFAIFFVVYVILCLYIFNSIVLATIYNNYKKNLKNEVKASVLLKRVKLAKAFELLKVKQGNEEVITHASWKGVMGILMPNRSSAYIDLLMKILDNDNKNVLDKKNFLNLSDLLNVQLTEVKDRQTILAKHFPNIYNHRLSEHFKFVVRHKYFRYAFDFLILVNTVFIAIDLDHADWFFLSIFAIEILCKLYVLGWKEYFHHFWNVFDLLVIGAAFVVSIIVEVITENTSEILGILDILLVLRVMRLFRIFGRIKRFKVIFQTLLNIGPSISTYGGVMFVFYYFFAIIGMEAFGGYINYYGYDNDQGDASNSGLTSFCGNADLNNTQFARDRYCKNNFNNIIQTMVVMFELTVVNNWHVIVSGYAHVTNKAARIYFFSFHTCCVVIVLNIFIAFILEAFILEFTLQTAPQLESVIETKIKEMGLGIGMKTKTLHIQGPAGDTIKLVDEEELPETNNTSEGDDLDSDTEELADLSKEKGLKFHLKKQRHKKVEILLQQMFQGELGDQEGDIDINMINDLQRKRRLTLEEVA